MLVTPILPAALLVLQLGPPQPPPPPSPPSPPASATDDLEAAAPVLDWVPEGGSEARSSDADPRVKQR